MADIFAGFPFGTKLRSQGRTIGEGDLSLLTNLTWTTSELHSNREYMKDTRFGDRILAGPCVVACVVGLAGRAGYGRVLEEHGLRVVAMLGLDEVRFTAPVLPGDTIWTEVEFLDARPSSGPGRAVLRIRDRGFKQSGEQVCEYLRINLIERIPE